MMGRLAGHVGNYGFFPECSGKALEGDARKSSGLVHVFEGLLMMKFGKLTVEGLEQGDLWD